MKLFQWFFFNQIVVTGSAYSFLFLFQPLLRPSCHPIAPPVSFPPLKQSPFSPHLMVPQKEPLSRLVLPQSYLLIGKPRGENNRYWLPHRVKLQGRMSGGVRKGCILHPLLPRCCQNSFSCHYPVPFHPPSLLPHNSLISPPFLNCQGGFLSVLSLFYADLYLFLWNV